MRAFIRTLLRESLNKQSYLDWAKGLIGKSRYRQWSFENPEKANKYWSLYAHLYDGILKPLGSTEELKAAERVVPYSLKNKEAIEAFKMFSMYKEDVLDGLLNEGER